MAAEPTTRKARILYVEDERALALTARERLEEAGFEVELSHDGASGFSKCVAGGFDVLITDLALPGLSGLEMARRLAAENALPPLIMVTGKGDETAAVESLKLGAKDYLVKDIEGWYVDRLPHIIRHILEERRLSEDKHRAEEALRESERRYRLLFEGMLSAFILAEAVRDEKGKIVDLRYLEVNRTFETMVGLKREAVQGRTFKEIFPDAKPIWVERLASVIMTGEPIRFEKRAETLRKDFDLAAFSTDRDRVAIVFNDITEVKKAEDQRKKLEERIGRTLRWESLSRMAGGLAHDLNNLLTGILGQAELAGMLLENDPGNVRECIEAISHSARRAAGIGAQLLATSGKGHFMLKSADLSALVTEMQPLLRSSIPETASMKFDLMPDMPFIRADIAQIKQLILNLVVNAGEAVNPESGRIDVRTGLENCTRETLDGALPDMERPEGPYVRLEVSDNGCGPAPEALEKIFDPFFSTKFTGRGLGLAAVLGIVRGHRGAIRVIVSKDSGTTFRVFIPVESVGNRLK